MNDEMVIKEIHDWHTRCATCGYGKGGWVANFKDEGDMPPLGPESKTCHGCGKDFTHVSRVSSYPGGDHGPEPING